MTQDVSAAAVNPFVAHNQMHDWSYFLGFTERAWNAQEFNFGTGGTTERDPLLGDVQAGAASGGFPSYLGRDNANMIPLPDGVPPITNMYLWQALPGAFYAPCVDGDFDMAVIGHEYGHLIENRMIGKGGTRSGHHAGTMGESFGDFDAAEYLNEFGFVPVSGEDPFSVGAYVTGNHTRAVRNYNMSWPRTGAFPEPGTFPRVNPLNFSDMGYDIVGQQVHANGEIWSAVNFDIRRALVAKYDAQLPGGGSGSTPRAPTPRPRGRPSRIPTRSPTSTLPDRGRRWSPSGSRTNGESRCRPESTWATTKPESPRSRTPTRPQGRRTARSRRERATSTTRRRSCPGPTSSWCRPRGTAPTGSAWT
ncbi:MAG TPA: M36 family metallopeptidase [Actinomycetota bacterium]|nr:M36 family metallopeptidase [Actinomycetota bacterium]